LTRFASRHDVAIWLQTGGPQTATPMDPDQNVDLTLALPDFELALPFQPTDFTQVNHRINEVLVRSAIRLLEPAPGERVVDFFCGLGNFALAMARRGAVVLGIEGNDELLRRAQQAARQHGLADCVRFAAANLFAWTEDDWRQLQQKFGTVDRVLIDPPREGALAVARAIATAAQPPRRIVYVSCNPATLARDCAVLAHEGGWLLRCAGAVNMFPHTSHVESIAMLEAASPATCAC
jgi:23S rRNA (uracil1939-C5)-methyltransferase